MGNEISLWKAAGVVVAGIVGLIVTPFLAIPGLLFVLIPFIIYRRYYDLS